MRITEAHGVGKASFPYAVAYKYLSEAQLPKNLALSVKEK
jgi:hypothetical protein